MSDAYFWLIAPEFQFALNKYFALSLMPSFSANKLSLFYNGLGYHVTTGLLFFPGGTTLKGWLIGLDPSIGMSHKLIDITDNLIDIGLIAKVGHQWIKSNGFTTSYWFGIGNKWIIQSDGDKYQLIKANIFGLPFLIGGNLSIGYSF
jgi:hypothetical protein